MTDVLTRPSDGGTVRVLVPNSTRESARSISGLLACALALIVALSPVSDGFYDFSRWGLLAAGVLALVVGLAASEARRPDGAALLALAGLVALTGWAALSLTWSESVDRSWLETNRLALYAGILAVGLGSIQGRGDAQRVVLTIGAAIAAVALWTTARMIAGDPSTFLQARLNAPVDYINGTAGLFLMGLWPALALAAHKRRPALAGIGMAAAVLQGNLVVLTQTRSALPVFAATALFVLVMYRQRLARAWALAWLLGGVAATAPWTLEIFAARGDGTRPVAAELLRTTGWAVLVGALAAGLGWAVVAALAARNTRPALRHAAAAVLVLGVVAAVGGGLAVVGDPRERAASAWRDFTSLQVSEDETQRFTGAGGFRYDLWRVAWQQFNERPLTGVGAGAYGLPYFQQRTVLESVRQPHNLGLQALAELGLVGGVLMVLVVGGLGIAALRVRRVDVLVGVAGVGMGVTWLVHSGADWLYNLPGLTGIAILGVAAAIGVLPGRVGSLGRFSRVAVIALIAVAAAALGRQYAADRYLKAAQPVSAENVPAVLERTQTALQLNPASMEAYYARAAAFARTDDYASARATLLQATAREPLNYVPWVLLGDLAVRRGEIAAANGAYGRALRLNPGEPALRTLVENPELALP